MNNEMKIISKLDRIISLLEKIYHQSKNTRAEDLEFMGLTDAHKKWINAVDSDKSKNLWVDAVNKRTTVSDDEDLNCDETS